MYEEIRDHGRLESGWPLVPGQVCSGQDLGEVSHRSHPSPCLLAPWRMLFLSQGPPHFLVGLKLLSCCGRRGCAGSKPSFPPVAGRGEAGSKLQKSGVGCCLLEITPTVSPVLSWKKKCFLSDNTMIQFNSLPNVLTALHSIIWCFFHWPWEGGNIRWALGWRNWSLWTVWLPI